MGLFRRHSPTGRPRNCIPVTVVKDHRDWMMNLKSLRFSVATFGYKNRGFTLHTSGDWQTIGKQLHSTPYCRDLSLHLSSAQHISTEQQPPSREQ